MDGYFAEVRLVAMREVPRNWLPCDGRLLSIRQNQAIFSLLGTSFGGDGINTFALPTLTAPAAGVRYLICDQGVYPDVRLGQATLGEIRLLTQDAVRRLNRDAPCDGRLLVLSQNTALFSLLGTNFGGDGRTTFGIPKLEAPDGLRYVLPLTGSYPRRP